jgi:signal transduction histidine kinase
MIHNNLGIAYCQLENYPRAIENYEKTLRISKSAVHKLTARNNIGYVYLSSGNYNKAFDFFKDLYASPHINDSLALKARVADNLGYAAYKLGKPEGLPLLNEGAMLRKEIGDEFGLIASTLHLGEALLPNDKGQAIANVLQAERLSAKTNSPDDRLLALHFLATNSAPAVGQKYASLYFRISDSLQTVRRKARNYFADVKYNYKLERDQNLKLQANQARLKLRQIQLENARLTWAIAAICIVFMAIIIVYIIVKRNRRARWKAAYETEVRISNRMHDELANDLHQAIIYTETNDLSEIENKNRLLDSLDVIYRRTRGISRENAAIGNEGFLETLKDLISSYSNTKQTVLAKGINDIAWNDLNEKQKVAVHRAIQELLVNMVKHSKCTAALLRFDQGENVLAVVYSDNGIGMPSTRVAKNGLSIMENRIEDLNGKITFGESGKGFRATIEFPVKYV